MRIALSAMTALAVVLWCPIVLAQATPGDINLIRDRQEQLLREQQQRLQELQSLPGSTPDRQPALRAEPDRCFQIDRIRLQGVSLFDAPTQQDLIEPYQGQCLGATGLNDLLKHITARYLDQGYVTARAYLPQQDMSDGELEVIVIEGLLEGLDGAGLASDREMAMAFPGAVGEHLNLRDLEQMIDQLGRLPSRQVQIELLPGEQMGGSRVQLKGLRSKPWQVALGRHNDGQLGTGEQQWEAALAWDSPLGLADQLRLRTGGDAVSDHWRHSSSQSLFYSVPYGWWTASYAYSQSYYRTLNQAANFDFTSDGESKRHQLTLERTLHRDSVGKTGASVGLAHLRTRNYIENSLLDSSSHRLSELQLGVNHGRRIGGAFVNGDIGWQHGIGAFDAQSNGRPQGSQPVAHYNKYTLTLSYLQPLRLWDESFSIESLVYGQRSEDVLFGPQRMSLGGLASVRGFKEQSLAGDSGFYWRNNLRWRRAVTFAPVTPWISEYGVALGYDLGAIRSDEYNPGQSGRLSGNALELSLRGKHIAASVTFAQSLVRPDALPRDENPTYFRIDLFF